MKRRWKVILTMGVFFVGITGLAAYLNGVNGGEQNVTLWFQITAAWLGFAFGIIVYSSGLEAEEREKREWKFQDDVYMNYEDLRVHKRSEEKAINETAIRYDISPTAVKSIVDLYEGN